jgi:hypothetical protein
MDVRKPGLVAVRKESFQDRRNEISDVIEPKGFYDRDILVIYGLYSRHGIFHGMNFPGLEFNPGELKHNVE